MSDEGNEVSFHLYREGDDSDVIIVKGPSEMTLAEFKQARESFAKKGYRFIVNGEETPLTGNVLTSIISDLNDQGIAIYIDGSKASDETSIRTGSRVTTAGEVKGNIANRGFALRSARS